MTFTSCLTLLFIALKLMGYVAWPWIYVFAPPLVHAALIVFSVLVVVLFRTFKR